MMYLVACDMYPSTATHVQRSRRDRSKYLNERFSNHFDVRIRVSYDMNRSMMKCMTYSGATDKQDV